jgi:hypothetical protein
VPEARHCKLPSKSCHPRLAPRAFSASLIARVVAFDPLLVAMLATRAIALVRLGQFEEAADWAVKAANRPNAFSHIRAIAAATLGLAGRLDEGRSVAASLHQSFPRYRVDDLLTTFQFAPQAEALFRKGAGRIALG